MKVTGFAGRWGVTRRIVWAWVLTIPGAALIGAGVYPGCAVGIRLEASAREEKEKSGFAKCEAAFFAASRSLTETGSALWFGLDVFNRRFLGRSHGGLSLGLPKVRVGLNPFL